MEAERRWKEVGLVVAPAIRLGSARVNVDFVVAADVVQ